MERIAVALRPRFEVLASPAARRQNLEKNLLHCTEQQFRVLDNASNNERLLVCGLAGTGKTTLAIEAVRRAKSTNPGAVIGFFCFNKLLGKKLENECNGIGEGVRLGSFHAWMLELSELKPSRNQTKHPEFWSRELPEICLAKLTAPGMPAGFLDMLVLDEAQDLFLGPYLDIFDLILKNGLKRGKWLFFGDFERQNIYAQGAVSKEDFYRQRIDERCSVQLLSENCRNTQEISAALSLHARLDPGYTRVLREDTRHDPDIIFYSDDAAQLIAVVGLLERLLSEGFKACDIVLLSPLRDQCLARSLEGLSQWKNRVLEFGSETKALSFTTIHAFKGMESPVVILTDIHKMESDTDLDILYIGMSRALHRLAVMCHDSVRDEMKKHCIK